jgi:hypothetical protein
MKQIPYTWTLDDEDSGDLQETIDEMIEEGKVILTVVPIQYHQVGDNTYIQEALIITH